MFRSRIRPLVIPQLEHARFAGALAAAWGNKEFQKPRLPFAEFVDGVKAHDRGYDEFDNLGIGEIAEALWLEVQLRGIERASGNTVTDIVVATHLRRLVSQGNKPGREAPIQKIETELERLYRRSEFLPEDFRFADSITHFCDNVSFDFCFEAAKQSQVLVRPQLGSESEIEITYSVTPNEPLVVDPWPFSKANLEGVLQAYEADGYPEKLTLVDIPYRIQPR